MIKLSQFLQSEADSLKSIENWHRYIDHQDVGIESLCFGDGILSIINSADDIKVFSQYGAYLLLNRFMVVSEQYSNLAHVLHASFSFHAKEHSFRTLSRCLLSTATVANQQNRLWGCSF